MKGESWFRFSLNCYNLMIKMETQMKMGNSNNSNGNGTKCGGKTKTCIQCAYHGWEFDKKGSCTLLPQLENNNPNGRSKVKPVQSFPLQLDVGMVWVWADSNPETADMSTAIDLPVSPLLRRHHQEYGDECCFMRDLPYGMELLEKTFWIYLIYPSPIILLVH